MWVFFIKGNDGRFFETEEVKINTGENFCTEHQIQLIDLLKLDVEGYEVDVLKGFGDTLSTTVGMVYPKLDLIKVMRIKTHISDILNVLEPQGFVLSGFYQPYCWGRSKFGVSYKALFLIRIC